MSVELKTDYSNNELSKDLHPQMHNEANAVINEKADKDEIAELLTKAAGLKDDDEAVPSSGLVKQELEKGLQGLVVPDMLAGNPSINSGAIGVTANKLYIYRCTMKKAGTLHDLNIWVGTKSGKTKMAVYDSGGAHATKYTRLAQGELETPTSNAWAKIFDPALAVVRGQVLYIGVIHNNATITMGRGGAGAVASGSAKLPASFIPAEGAEPKLAAHVEVGSFECPAEIAEASMVVEGETPYMVMGRIS